MTHCRSCGASIEWAITDTGSRMPVDVEKVAGGNLEAEQIDGRLHVHVREPAPDEYAYVSHFATCPQSKEWRVQP